MASLKEKLCKKVEVIESNTVSFHDSNLIKESNDNNIIMLNSNSKDKIQSVVPDFAITLNDARNRIEMLQSFVREMMIANVDYGFIPNCNKPSLFKSGAEKLCDIFGFSKQIEVINRVEDWDKALFHYEIKTTLINKRTGLIEAEGIGSCNNKERKFKNQDGYSIVNNILKMAKKRAFIDAVLSATRSSGLFTQDIEDIYEESNKKINNNNETTKRASSSLKTNAKAETLINKTQQSKIVSLVNINKISINDVKSLMKERYNVAESKSLSATDAEDFIQYLKIYTSI